MFNLFPFIIIIFCLSAIIFIIARKFKDVRQLKTEHHLKLAQSKTKIIMIEKRLASGIKAGLIKLKFIPHILGGGKIKPLAVWLESQHRKLLEIKKNYKIAVKKKAQQTNETDNELSPEKIQKIQTLLTAAQDLFKQELFKEAEDQYIEIISLAPKNIEAYRGLAEVYLANKSQTHAETTLEHILKLASTLSDRQIEDFVNLGLVKQELGKNAEAQHYLSKALEIEPLNPRYLDLYLESCVLCKDKETAWSVYRKLKEVNPENHKLDEFVEKIRTLRT